MNVTPANKPPYVTFMGSRTTVTSRTISYGRLREDRPVAGSVTLNPSRVTGVSYALAPLTWSKPSGPRTTDGKSGSDSLAFICADDGIRATASEVTPPPSAGLFGATIAVG